LYIWNAHPAQRRRKQAQKEKDKEETWPITKKNEKKIEIKEHSFKNINNFGGEGKREENKKTKKKTT
jgi:hypothetical protein